MRILVLTVGGSPQPLVTSLKKGNPDKVIFLCSADSPLTKGSYTMVEGVLQDAGRDTSSSAIVEIQRFDDFNDCYAAGLRTLERLRQEHPEAEIIADYTGGTKSMSAGLAAAVLDCPGVVLGLVQGDRTNLIKVSNGTQSLRLTQAHKAILERQKRVVTSFFERYDYAAAASLVENILGFPDLPPSESQLWQQWLVEARAWDSWDRFDHAAAWKLIHPRRKEYLKLVMFLQACIHSRRTLEEKFKDIALEGIGATEKGHGYELVEDLYLNAQRRAAQSRYDDAVARLYRALELLAQARLKMQHEIDTSDVNPEKLPEPLRKKYQGTNGSRATLALTPAFALLLDLSQFHNEPLGKLYQVHRQRLREFLKIRNSSILAHGTIPVTEADYRKALNFFESFLEGAFSCLSQAGMLAKPYAARRQFPRSPYGTSGGE